MVKYTKPRRRRQRQSNPDYVGPIIGMGTGLIALGAVSNMVAKQESK